MINRFSDKENNYEILTDLRKTEFWDELKNKKITKIAKTIN
jgi:hypothetical protein